MEQDLAALFLGFLADQFPKLSRTILRIPELFDQRGFRIFVVLLAGTLGDHVFQHGTDRQPLDTLSTPVCGDLAGVSAPQLFRVALEEHAVQHLAEPVDVEVFQIGFRLLGDAGTEVAEASLHGGGKAHALNGVLVHSHRIIEEMLVEIDVGNAVTHQHDYVFLFRIRATGFQRLFPSQFFIIKGRLSLNGHQV